MKVNIEPKVVSSDPPPAYCTLVSSESCLDASRTPAVVVSDGDEETLVGASFLDKTARIGFIQKVLAIRCLQALAALVIINLSMFWYYESYNPYIRENQCQLMILSIMLHLATILPLICHRREATMRPFNIMFLVAYPLTSLFVLLVITKGFLRLSLEFCFAWYCYTVMLLGQLIFSVFCLHTSVEYRMRSAMLLGAVLTIFTFGLSILSLALSYYGPYYWDFSIPWLCFFTLLVFGECALTQCHLSAMTSEEYHSRLTPADFMTGTLYTYMVFGYNYSKYWKRFKSKVCSYFV